MYSDRIIIEQMCHTFPSKFVMVMNDAGENIDYFGVVRHPSHCWCDFYEDKVVFQDDLQSTEFISPICGVFLNAWIVRQLPLLLYGTCSIVQGICRVDAGQAYNCSVLC